MSAAGLLQAILDNPEDDTPRLVYADWLDDHDQPERAAFIRVQCEKERLPENDPRRAELAAQEKALLGQHRDAWLQEVQVWARRHVAFRRGFVAEVTATTQQVLRGLPGLLRRAPVETLNTGPGRGLPFEKLMLLPELQKIRYLYVGAVNLAAVRALGASPHLGKLTHLDLNLAASGAEVGRCLGGAAFAPHLRHLTIRTGLGPEGAAALAASSFAELASLRLYSTRIGDSGVAALAGAPQFTSLSVLVLFANDISARGAAALASSPYLTGLASLELNLNHIGDDGAGALARSAALGSLSALYLNGCDIGTAGAEALSASRYLKRLTVLDLNCNHIGNAGAMALAESANFANLTALELWDNGVTAAGIHALATSPHLPRLTRVGLGNGGASSAELAALRQQFERARRPK